MRIPFFRSVSDKLITARYRFEFEARHITGEIERSDASIKGLAEKAQAAQMAGNEGIYAGLFSQIRSQLSEQKANQARYIKYLDLKAKVSRLIYMHNMTTASRLLTRISKAVLRKLGLTPHSQFNGADSLVQADVERRLQEIEQESSLFTPDESLAISDQEVLSAIGPAMHAHAPDTEPEMEKLRSRIMQGR